MFEKLFKKKPLFFITALVFLVLVTFIDKNNLLDSWKLQSKIDGMQDQKSYYLNKIEEDSTIIENLKDDKFLEKYARENYYMKKDSEVVYIIK